MHIVGVDQMDFTPMYKGVFRSFWTGCLEQELKMVQLSAIRYSCISIL